MTTPSTNLTIFHDSQEWSTDIAGEIGEIRVDGKRLSDIHDLTKKVDRMTKIIRSLALTATFLAIIAVGGISYIGSWLVSNKAQIAQTMDTTEDLSVSVSQLKSSNIQMRLHLRELGWEWSGRRWQQIANTAPSVSK